MCHLSTRLIKLSVLYIMSKKTLKRNPFSVMDLGWSQFTAWWWDYRTVLFLINEYYIVVYSLTSVNSGVQFYTVIGFREMDDRRSMYGKSAMVVFGNWPFIPTVDTDWSLYIYANCPTVMSASCSYQGLQWCALVLSGCKQKFSLTRHFSQLLFCSFCIYFREH